MLKAPVTVTPAALDHARGLLAGADEGVIGLRVGVKSRGCSGYSYSVDYAREQKKFEDVVEMDDVKIFIDPAAAMFVIGSTMDFEDHDFHTGFVFKNPNEKGRCGCGESFHV